MLKRVNHPLSKVYMTQQEKELEVQKMVDEHDYENCLIKLTPEGLREFCWKIVNYQNGE